MSGKTATGVLLMVVGIATVLYALNYMNSFGARLGRELGLQDNTGVILLAAGGAVAAVGLLLSISRSRTAA